MAHLKFAWIDSVYAEDRFTPADKAILVYCAIKGVYGKQHDFTLNQTLIAERVGVGTATVKRAVSKAREYGYLALAAERQRGRGHTNSDRHRIVLPSPLHEIGISNDRNRDQNHTEIGINSDDQNTVLPAETTPLRVKERVIKGSGPLRDAAPPPCPRHPNGYRHNEPCGSCAKLRDYDRDRPTPTPPRHVPQQPDAIWLAAFPTGIPV